MGSFRARLIVRVSARFVLEAADFVLKHLLDAVLGDEDVSDGDPQPFRGVGANTALRDAAALLRITSPQIPYQLHFFGASRKLLATSQETSVCFYAV